MLVSVTMFQIAVFRFPLFFVLFLCEEKWKHWKYNYMLGAFLDSTEGLVSNISL